MRTMLLTTAALLLFATSVTGQTRTEGLAIRAARLHIGDGTVLENAVVLVREGRIQTLGGRADVTIPPSYRTLDAAVVTPGLIDAHSVVGLAGYLNSDHDQEQVERSSPIQADLRALDAFNPSERLVTWLREHGVTTVHTGPAPIALLSGQGLIAKTTGRPVAECALVPSASVLASLSDGARAEDGKSPGTKAKMVAMLRAELVRAREYAAKLQSAEPEKPPERDLGLETLARVLARDIPLVITAHRARDILSALRLAEEFEFRLVLDGAAEVYLVTDAVKRAGVPVVLHAPMMRSRGEAENASMETAATLAAAGIPFTLQSGYESYVPKTRVVLFEAAIAASYGLGREAAIRAVTLDAARILGIADRVGSIEPGKDADLVLFDGDPLEYTSHVTGVVIDGRVVSQESR